MSCKHVHAARFARERDHGGKPPVIDTDTAPKRPTCRQDRTAYNLARITEKQPWDGIQSERLLRFVGKERNRKSETRTSKGRRCDFQTWKGEIRFGCWWSDTYSTVPCGLTPRFLLAIGRGACSARHGFACPGFPEASELREPFRIAPGTISGLRLRSARAAVVAVWRERLKRPRGAFISVGASCQGTFSVRFRSGDGAGQSGGCVYWRAAQCNP